MNSDFYERLDARVRDLESSVHGLRAELDSTRAVARAAAPPTAPVQAPPPEPPAPVSAPVQIDAPRQARPGISFETLLAGRAMPIAGLLLVLLAAAFFLDQAFRNGWIGPLERIILGLVVGSALIVVSARRISAAYTFLAEGLIGLGAGILYLSLWAAVAKFPELHVSRPAVFAAMIAVTAVLSVLATTRHSQRLALMGMFGGFITPVLIASGPPDRVVLAAYLLVLAAGMLWVSVRSSFRFVEALTFVALVFYAPAFAVDQARHWGDVQCAVVATLFFAAFAIGFTLGALRDGVASNARIVLLGCDVLFYVLALEVVFDHKQTTLGIILLVLAAALLAAARVPALPRRLHAVYAYLGLAVVTLAIPALFHSTSLIDVFAVEAALLVVIGARNADRWLFVAGAVIFAFTGLAIVGQGASDPPHATIFNPLSLGFAIYLAALGFAIARYAASAELTSAQRGWRDIALVAWNVVALAALSRECVDLFGGPKGLDSLTNEAQFGLSAIWTIDASVLFALGVARHRALLRWLGIVLFGITIFKVFVVDMASLNVMYRILSFLILGVLLVAASIGYQRAMVSQKGPEAQG